MLRDIAYFEGLPPSELRRLETRLRERRYRASETIFSEGESCAGLYLVLSGRVRLFRVSPEGREVVVRVLGPGHTFAEPAVFDEGPLPASAVAMEPSTVALLPKRDVFALVEGYPPVMRAVLRLFGARIRAFAVLVEERATKDVVSRVAALLLEHARGRGSLLEDSARLSVRMTHHELAAMVGSVREVVQRALKLLELEGAVKLQRGRIHIADSVALQRWSRVASVR
jgi:CRP/FNR family transcriptional regulator